MLIGVDVGRCHCDQKQPQVQTSLGRGKLQSFGYYDGCVLVCHCWRDIDGMAYEGSYDDFCVENNWKRDMSIR